MRSEERRGERRSEERRSNKRIGCTQTINFGRTYLTRLNEKLFIFK